MEIELGNFYFKAEGTVALILALVPVTVVMMIPRVTKSIQAIVYLIKRYRRPTLQDVVDKAGK